MTTADEQVWRPETLLPLTTPELLRLKRALEGGEGMVVDVVIYKAVLDTLWDREATPTTSWPTSVLEGGVRVVHFCGGTFIRDPDLDLGPDDPEHRPTRSLSLPSGEQWFECSCGRRDGGDGGTVQNRSATERLWRVVGEPGRWPYDDTKKVYRVCRGTRDVNNRAHAFAAQYEAFHTGDGRVLICICGLSSYDDEVTEIVSTHVKELSGE
jgi:hypothetical protein